MTLDEAIKTYTSNAEYERIHGNLQGCLDFRQLTEWLKELKAYRDDYDCDYETLKIKLENAEDIIRGLQEDLREAREEMRWR